MSRELNLLQGGGTEVVLGDLLTIPTGGDVQYVEPVYVERTGQTTSFPQLNSVLVLADDRVRSAPTDAAALAKTGAAPPAGGPVPLGEPVPLPVPQDAVARDAAADLLAALERLRAAKAAGDLVAEGEALTAIGDAARRFEDAAGMD